MTRTIAIVAARLGSHRFPEKVLLDLHGRPVLWHVVNRCRQIAGVDDVVVATTFSDADQALVSWCQLNHIPIARGGATENDVLGRYYDVATQHGADVIVRVTADCPMLDADTASMVVAQLVPGLDYSSNVNPPTFPDGLDTEAFTYETLDRLNRIVEDANEREHVTLFVAQHPGRFKVANVGHDPDLSNQRWTVDFPEDLAFMQSIFAELGDDFNMQDVLTLLETKPELAQINSGHNRNEGLKPSKKRENKA